MTFHYILLFSVNFNWHILSSAQEDDATSREPQAFLKVEEASEAEMTLETQLDEKTAADEGGKLFLPLG